MNASFHEDASKGMVALSWVLNAVVSVDEL